MTEVAKKPYVYATGMVQAFTKEGVKQPAVRSSDVNGQIVHNVKIKTSNQGYVDVALWSEFAAVAPKIGEGYIVFVDGPYELREVNGVKYHKINATRLAVLPCCTRVERPVENAAPAADTTFAPTDDPVAAAQAALAAAQAAAGAAAAPAPEPANAFNF